MLSLFLQVWNPSCNPNKERVKSVLHTVLTLVGMKKAQDLLAAAKIKSDPGYIWALLFHAGFPAQPLLISPFPPCLCGVHLQKAILSLVPAADSNSGSKQFGLAQEAPFQESHVVWLAASLLLWPHSAAHWARPVLPGHLEGSHLLCDKEIGRMARSGELPVLSFIHRFIEPSLNVQVARAGQV